MILNIQQNTKLESVFDVSIDRLTIVGDVVNSEMKKFRELINFSGCVKLHDSLQTKVNGMFFKEVYFEYDSIKASQRNIRNFRMDFNPNSLKDYEKDWVKENVIPLLKNVGLTRVDIAFDTTVSLNEFTYIERNPKKRNLHYGRNGVLETLYIGVRGSDVVMRIYDKKNEAIDTIAKNERRVFAISEDKTFATNEQLQEEVEYLVYQNEQLQRKIKGKEKWWRFEFELRKNAVNFDGKLFEGLSIIKPVINKDNVPRIQDRAILEYLDKHPEEWNELSRPTKLKYKEMLRDLNTEEDFSKVLEEKFEQKKNDLLQQVANWLNVSKEELFVGDELNLRHV